MQARKRALTAAACAAIPLAFGVVAAMTFVPLATAASGERLAWLLPVAVATTLGCAVNAAAIVMLAGPVLGQYWVEHQRALAVWSSIGIASLMVLYAVPAYLALVFGAFGWAEAQVPLGLALMVGALVTIVAVPISLALAIATAVGAHRAPVVRRHLQAA